MTIRNSILLLFSLTLALIATTEIANARDKTIEYRELASRLKNPRCMNRYINLYQTEFQIRNNKYSQYEQGVLATGITGGALVSGNGNVHLGTSFTPTPKVHPLSVVYGGHISSLFNPLFVIPATTGIAMAGVVELTQKIRSDPYEKELDYFANAIEKLGHNPEDKESLKIVSKGLEEGRYCRSDYGTPMKIDEVKATLRTL